MYSWLSDQAKQESRVADAPASAARHLAPRREAWTDGEANEFLFPLAIAFNDVLHILYNALELGISSLEWWPGVNNQLTEIVACRVQTRTLAACSQSSPFRS